MVWCGVAPKHTQAVERYRQTADDGERERRERDTSR